MPAARLFFLSCLQHVCERAAPTRQFLTLRLLSCSKVPWGQKRDVLFFRGSRTTETRDKLVELGQHGDLLLDIQFTKGTSRRSDAQRRSDAHPQVHLREHCSYRCETLRAERGLVAVGVGVDVLGVFIAPAIILPGTWPIFVELLPVSAFGTFCCAARWFSMWKLSRTMSSFFTESSSTHGLVLGFVVFA